MSRRLIFTVFAVLVLAVGGFTYFVLQDSSSRWQIPVISDNEEPLTEETPPTPKAEPAPAAFYKTKYSLTDPTSPWVVVNKQRPLSPLSYAPSDLASAGGGQQLRQEAATALAAMFAAAKAKRLTLQALSGYRSYSRQQTVYQNYVDTYGQASADTFSAKPGYSEHQSGWAIDIGGGGCGIEDCFANTAEGKWVAVDGYKYGFIVRYPASKQDVTGYKYEPWHIRYIGVELATEMHTQDSATLEEFFSL